MGGGYPIDRPLARVLTPTAVSTGKIAGVPANVFVKGGTTSLKWDREQKRQYEQADARRRHQDRQRAAVRAASGSPGIRAALLSMQLSAPMNPKVVLTYKARDRALEREAICELIEEKDSEGNLQYRLLLVCPKCLERTGRQDYAQTMVWSAQKKFWLDDSKAGIWVDPESGMSYRIAGSITTAERCQCTALGCDWKFRIEDSKLYGSHHYAM